MNQFIIINKFKINMIKLLMKIKILVKFLNLKSKDLIVKYKLKIIKLTK